MPKEYVTKTPEKDGNGNEDGVDIQKLNDRIRGGIPLDIAHFMAGKEDTSRIMPVNEEETSLKIAKPEGKKMSEIIFRIYDSICGTIGNVVFEITGRNKRKAEEDREKLKERLRPVDSD